MVPQAANNNDGPWAKLETYERTLAAGGKELFIVSGPVFGANPDTIGNGVAVPDQTFKVIVVLDHAGDGAGDVTTATRVIAVEMPNDDSRISTSDSWQKYRVSARRIEDDTSLDFLADVAPSVQDVVESRVDNQ